MTKPEFERLATEERNPRTADLDRMSTFELLEAMNREDRSVAGVVATEIPRIARAVDAIAARVARGGRLIYTGAGTSGRIGALDAVECGPTFDAGPQQVR
jgi:N-acetylmuramic acid 6-phosphate etherase